MSHGTIALPHGHAEPFDCTLNIAAGSIDRDVGISTVSTPLLPDSSGQPGCHR